MIFEMNHHRILTIKDFVEYFNPLDFILMRNEAAAFCRAFLPISDYYRYHSQILYFAVFGNELISDFSDLKPRHYKEMAEKTFLGKYCEAQEKLDVIFEKNESEEMKDVCEQTYAVIDNVELDDMEKTRLFYLLTAGFYLAGKKPMNFKMDINTIKDAYNGIWENEPRLFSDFGVFRIKSSKSPKIIKLATEKEISELFNEGRVLSLKIMMIIINEKDADAHSRELVFESNGVKKGTITLGINQSLLCVCIGDLVVFPMPDAKFSINDKSVSVTTCVNNRSYTVKDGCLAVDGITVVRNDFGTNSKDLLCVVEGESQRPFLLNKKGKMYLLNGKEQGLIPQGLIYNKIR